VSRTWDTTATGVLRFPSGRLVRGRGLRRPLPDGALPDFGLYLLNEKAARSVAGGVVLLAALTLGLSVVAGHGWLWIAAVLAYGFLARVLTGPTLSPLGQLATRFAAPRFGTANSVAGPPKRFVPESVNLYEALICTYY
jgi:hypothetical protein